VILKIIDNNIISSKDIKRIEKPIVVGQYIDILMKFINEKN